MSEEDKQKKKENKIKELVLARLGIMPPNYKLSVGNSGTLTKDKLIEHVKQEDETGKQIIGMQLNFIKALTSGKLMKALNK